MNWYSLRALEARLLKTVRVETQEKGDDGLYVFRGDDGEPFMWSPRPYRHELHPVDSVAEADSVSFLCPVCFAKNGGAKGTHSVYVSFAGRDIPDDVGSHDSNGNPSRWAAGGGGIDDLQLSPSILLDAGRAPDQGCHWHGYVGSSGIPAGCAG